MSNKNRVSLYGRSVKDYSTEDELREALEAVTLTEHPFAGVHPEIPQLTSDWRLPVPDVGARKESVDVELQRLLTLKSYLVLDAEKERAFDELTNEACRVYGVPTSAISLVDLGRQFMFSEAGGGSVRETSRALAFCSHTILNKDEVMVVNDTKLDPRFCENRLVTEAPHLRFYAGAPLVSPEGYNLGTFCVEGQEPRPQGLTDTEKETLKQYAKKTMDLLVERRRRLTERLTRTTDICQNLRRHAGVANNLGDIMYQKGQCMTAMRFFQETVQVLMHVDEENSVAQLPSDERQAEMSQLLTLLSAPSMTDESRAPLIKKAKSLFQEWDGMGPELVCKECVVEGIPGLFGASSKLIANFSPTSSLFHTGLIFAESFRISMETPGFDGVHYPKNAGARFIIPLEQCSKATLFNMGLIHYHWGSPDSAVQFFDLAKSLSHSKKTGLDFDPVVLGCLNNMAQIHLQYGRPNDAMELLADALTRGNAALATMYGEDSPVRHDEQDLQRTRRLRRKLARTVMNMGHVHFFNCDYDAAMNTCHDALRLLHPDMGEMEVAAVWYNMAMLHYHKGNKHAALEYFDRFLRMGAQLRSKKDMFPRGPSPVQISDVLHRKGYILFEMGFLYSSLKTLNESLRLRQYHFGSTRLGGDKRQQAAMAESLGLIGRVLQALEQYDFAQNALTDVLKLQKRIASQDPTGQQVESSQRTNDDGSVATKLPCTFEVAQTLLELGRALHAQENLSASLSVYTDVGAVARTVFGDKHVFVARINNILGNLHLEARDVKKGMELFEEASRINVQQGMNLELTVVQDPLIWVDLPWRKEALAATAGAA